MPLSGTTDHIRPRAVTEEEAAFFRAHGWVKLDKLITSEEAEVLLQPSRAVLENRTDAEDGASVGGPYRNPHHPLSIDLATGSPSDQYLYEFSHSPEMGMVGETLCGERGVLESPPGSSMLPTSAMRRRRSLERGARW